MPTIPATIAAIDLDMLAYDLANTMDRYGYAIDVADDAIRPHLPAFLAAVLAEQERITAELEGSDDAARWTPAQADEAEQNTPAIQRGRRPQMTYLPWHKSQTTNLGANAPREHYWQCYTTGCRVWAGPYTDPMECKRVGMDHQYREHDKPKWQAQDAAKAARARS